MVRYFAILFGAFTAFFAASLAVADCLLPMAKVSGPVLAANLGLHYIAPKAASKGPGISRTVVETVDSTGSKIYSYNYFDRSGHLITDENQIAALNQGASIPRGYTGVWISDDPLTHVIGVGTDSKGGVQYFYHRLWDAARAREKFHRMAVFGVFQEKLAAQVDADLSLSGFSKDKVTAAVLALMDRSLIRVGNEEYLKKNGTSGLTTMLKKDVKVEGDVVTFDFVGKSMGKSGKKKQIPVKDERLANVVSALMEIPGEQLFQYEGEASGQWHDLSSDDVNAYMKEATGAAFTAKDFRTWRGTVYAAQFLRIAGPFGSEAEGLKNINLAAKFAASKLHNTWTVCKQKYIDPVVLSAYLKQKPFFDAFAASGESAEGAVILMSSEIE